jgi:peptide/nickel transport system substrate-binding protein
MLEKGEINLAWDLQPAQIKRLETNPAIQLYQTPILRLNFINMSLGYPPLEKPEVRQAIRFAIDYDAIVDYILEGEAVKIQTIIPKGILGHNPKMPYSPDINKAKQLLADAGYPDGFEVELMCLNYEPWSDIAFQIKKDLAQIGINVTIAQKEVPQMLEKVMSRDFQMFLWEWEFDYPDPDAMAKPFAHSDSLGDDATIKIVAWVCKYVNVETSKLVDQAAQELDNEKRKQLYQQITETMLYDGPTAILYSPIKQYGISSDIMDWIGIPSFVFGGFPMLK